MNTPDKHLVIGKITGAFGIKGWVKVHSYTEPEGRLFQYNPLHLRLSSHEPPVPVTVEHFQAHGKGYIAKFKEIPDRTRAEQLRHCEFTVHQDQLPRENVEEDLYWQDLIGITVVNTRKITLGTIQSLFNTGSNDILVVKGLKEHLIPYLEKQTILNLDLDNKIMTVDWDENF